MKKRVLAIDDEKVVLDSIAKVLREEDYEVMTTQSGAEGVRLAVRESFDVVLTDIRMPDTDGFKVIRDIRRAGKAVPIIMITGYASVSSSVQAMKLGASNYIEKPFTPEQLIRAIGEAAAESAGELEEEVTLIHKKEVLKVLEKGAKDPDFARSLSKNGADALEKFDLTSQEKLAIITGDIRWIEDQIGSVKPEIKRWLPMQ